MQCPPFHAMTSLATSLNTRPQCHARYAMASPASFALALITPRLQVFLTTVKGFGKPAQESSEGSGCQATRGQPRPHDTPGTAHAPR